MKLKDEVTISHPSDGGSAVEIRDEICSNHNVLLGVNYVWV